MSDKPTSGGEGRRRKRVWANRLVIPCALGAFAVVLAACGSSGGTKTGTTTKTTTTGAPYKVAIVSELTGAYANPTGVNVAAGAEAYFKQLNASGGVNGHPVDYGTPYDLQGSETAGGAAFRQAISANPLALIGYPSSNTAASVESFLDSANIPSLFAAGPDTWLGPPPKAWYFDTSTGIGTHALAVTKEAGARLGGLKGKKVDIIGLQAVSVDEAIAVAEKEITSQGGTVGMVKRTPATQVDYASETAAIAADHPDAVEQYLVGPAVVTFSKELITAGFNGPDVSWSTGSGSSVIEAIASANFFSDRIGAEPSANNTLGKAAAAAGVTSQATTSDFATGYESAAIVAKALPACGAPQACTASKLEAAIDNLAPLTVSGAFFGPMKFTSDDHFGQRTYEFFTYDLATKAVVEQGAGIVVNVSDIPK